MNFSKIVTLLKVSSVFGLCLFLLSACLTTGDSITSTNDNDEERLTLKDLANEQIARELNEVDDKKSFTLSKKQRAIKLAALYQNILTIEPNEEIRTKISYRLAQIDMQAYELQQDSQDNTGDNQKELANLILSYQNLLARYPNRSENEEVHYQLAKALSLQGKLDKSLAEIDIILATFPESRYKAELHFRRADIYYNLQNYSKAFSEYQAVIQSNNNESYYVNSVYMSGWTLFKLNRLSESDKTFLSLVDFIISQAKIQPIEKDFSFSKLDNRYADLLNDIQRVLSISLSQQSQSKTLVSLVENYQGNEFNDNYLYLYRHILFKNLAFFLLENGLTYDAELTYLSYMSLAPNSLWSARYMLLLSELYSTQGKHQAIQKLQIQYVKQFGMGSVFWQQSLLANQTSVANTEHLMAEILPNVITFSYQHSRILYAKAQSELNAQQKAKAFSDTADWLQLYLSHAKLPEAEIFINELEASQGVLADELLFADASFEAQLYEQALASYEYIAYQVASSPELTELMRKEAAYAATLTTRKLLNHRNNDNSGEFLATRNRLDKAFIESFPTDERATALAVQQAQFALGDDEYQDMLFYSDFVLKTHGVISNNSTSHTLTQAEKSILLRLPNDEILNTLSDKPLKEVQITSQLQANYWYQQERYSQAEVSYELALQFVSPKSSIWVEMRELIAASIYFQGQALAMSKPMLAVEHLLRLGEKVPETTYWLGAQYDAANLLFSQQQWQAAIDVYTAFQHAYPNHKYSRSIPAKLAQSYEHLEQWQLAAAQYLALIEIAKSEPNSSELQREALYSAAELYLKANNLEKAIDTFRTYAHSYPEPFGVAQEVRYKMSQFYQQTKEPNKEYYWYRKILKFHEQAFNEQSQSNNSRSVYLASVAALGLGQAHQQTFKHIKLTLPLNKSLARKQTAMKTAIDYYKKLLAFQLAEFVPHGTYNLAQMYRQLGKDVMSSQRPKDLDELALEEYDILLEEIVYPFEEKAIEIHTNNAQRAWQNIYDQWVMKSFTALAELEPALYDRSRRFNLKKEGEVHVIRTLH